MNTRDQPAAGDDPAKTVLLDDTYRIRFECGNELGDNEQAVPKPVLLASSPLETAGLEDRWRDAQLALDRALAEFKTAASVVIDRIKMGESPPRTELEREWRAQRQLVQARKEVERLGRSAEAFTLQNNKANS